MPLKTKNTDIKLFVARVTKQASTAQGLFKVGPGSDTLGIHKNASGPVGIPLKSGTSGHCISKEG